jgi:hypothetical protein
MRKARAVLTVMVATAVLAIGGNVRAQPLDNPDLSDVVQAIFTNSTKSGYSVVMVNMNGGSGRLYPRFYGYRYANTKDGAVGVLAMQLYEPDDIKRKGAGSWQMKQSDFARFAFYLTATAGAFSANSPYASVITSIYSYSGAPFQSYPMWFIGAPFMPISGCKGSFTAKDKNGNGLPESASWKVGCNPKAFSWLSSDDQKLYKKVIGELKGKGQLPAYWGYNY